MSSPCLYRFFVVSSTSISFPFPPFLFRFFRVSFPFLFVFRTRNEGGGSREGAGRTEDFDQNPRLTCSKHGRTYDNHKALFHVIWEYMVRFCLKWKPQRFLTVSKTFPYRFFTISLPFPSHFFTVSVSVSLPFPLPFLFHFQPRKEMGKKCSQRFL